jgi:transposase
VDSLVDGKSIDDIIEGLPVKKLSKKAPEIREAIIANLDITQIILIRGSLELISDIKKRIDELENEIRMRIASRASDLRIVMSMPGIGFISAVTILAEIGNYQDFEKPEQLAAWAGLVPSVYQSADKLVTGSITKHVSSHLRWMLVQVAHAIAHTKNTKLKRFFLRVRAKKGYKVAIVALARKVLCILHHLLTNQEVYVEEGVKEPKAITFKVCV